MVADPSSRAITASPDFTIISWHNQERDSNDADTRSCAGLPRAWITNPEGGNTTRKKLFGELHASEPDRFHMAMSMG